MRLAKSEIIRNVTIADARRLLKRAPAGSASAAYWSAVIASYMAHHGKGRR